MAAAVALVLVLAGCADLTGPGADGDGADGADVESMTPEETMAAWAASFDNVEELDAVTAMQMTIALTTAEHGTVLDYEVAVDTEADAFLFRMSFDEAIFEEAGSESAAAPGFFSDLTIGQVVDDGVVYTIFPNVTGTPTMRRDHVPDEDDFFESLDDLEEDTSGGAGPDLSPGSFLLGLNETGDDLEVLSAEKVTWKGRPAWRVTFRQVNTTARVEGDMVLYEDPPLPAHADVHFEATGTGAGAGVGAAGTGPLAGVTEGDLTMDLLFGDEVTVELPDAQRGPVSVQTSEQVTGTGIEGGIAGDHDEEVPLDEIELHVGDSADTGGGFGLGFGERAPPGPVHLALLAADTTGSNDMMTLSYDDADGDGLLSAGDTYLLTVHDDDLQGNVTIYWYDLWAAQYETVPGPGPLTALTALAVAALALWVRRRRG